MDRIATSTAYQSVLNNLLSTENREITAQQQVSTGNIADNLSGFGNQTQALIATQSVKSRVDGLVSQLNQTGVQLTFQQSALNQISTVAQSLQQALTTAQGVGTGDTLMSQVQSLFSQAASALNTQYNGSYIFSGGQTSTQPFTATTLSTLTTQPSVSSFFQDGSLTPVSRIDDNTTVQTGFLATNVGSALMGVFQSIQAFQQSGAGNFGGALTAAQQTFLDSAISQLNTVTASTTQTTAEGGAIQAQVAAALTTQTDRQTTLAGVLGTMTNADAATAATNLTQAQTAFQASAQVFNSLKGMSLLNYLTSSTTVA
jgi:flagellar hook-associated protein 3 FlgL